jgi:hypothetical protein
MTRANPEQPELCLVGILELLPSGEQTATDPLDNRQISRLNGRSMSHDRIIKIVHNHRLLDRKVPKEHDLCDPGCGGDICNCRLVVATIGKRPSAFRWRRTRVVPDSPTER